MIEVANSEIIFSEGLPDVLSRVPPFARQFTTLRVVHGRMEYRDT